MPELSQQADEPTDLQLLFDKVRARAGWIVFSIVVATGAFAAAAFLLAPVYRATSVLISASEERNSVSGSLSSALGQLGGLAALAGVSVGSSDAATQEALAVLRSRQFTEAVIVDLDLVPVLFPDAWDPVAKRWKAEPPTPAQAFKRFAEIRKINLDTRTGLVTLQIEWSDPEQAAQWANELALRLNSEMRGRAIRQADASLKFLEAELTATAAVETREAINRLVEAQIRQRMLANVTQEYSFRIVDRAMPSDTDDPVRPNKLLLLVLGPLVGLVVGIAFVLAYDLLFSRPRRAAN